MNKMIRYVALLLFISYLPGFIPVFSQSPAPNVERRTMGILVDNKTHQTVGLGFVVNTTKTIVTCAHVISSTDYTFTPLGPDFNVKKPMPPSYTVRLVGKSDERDVAVLSADSDIVTTPLKMGSFKTVKIGDTLWYLKEMTASPAQLANTVLQGEGMTVRPDKTRFRYFEAPAIPFLGHTCGPILDGLGTVVGLEGEVWQKLDSASGGREIFVRFFDAAAISEFLSKAPEKK
jgi:hypothetical protein